MLGRPPPNPCPPSNKMLFSPHFGSERHSVSLQTPYSPKGGGDWDTKINIPVKMHLRCCGLARIFANYSRMAININDYSWSINDHSCPHKNISSALRAFCVLKGIIILNSRFMPYPCSWSYGRLLHTVFLWSHTDSFLETLGKVLRGTEARHVGYFCDGVWCLA